MYKLWITRVRVDPPILNLIFRPSVTSAHSLSPSCTHSCLFLFLPLFIFRHLFLVSSFSFFTFTYSFPLTLLPYSLFISLSLSFSLITSLPPSLPPIHSHFNSINKLLHSTRRQEKAMTQATPTLAELSLSLTHVQSLLRQITAEVKVLSDGITHLVAEQEENDLEEELDYLDVDPWSKAKDKDHADATTGGAGATGAHRQDSIRSLLQRKPSTVKDETKALARILSQKRTPPTTNGEAKNDPEQLQTQQHLSAAKWVALGLQDQVIDEDSVSSDGSISGAGKGGRNGDKHELDLLALDQDQQGKALSSFSSATSSIATIPQPPEAERTPHTITVQTTQMPTKFSLAITKPSTPQSPSVPVLSASSSQSSILSAMNNMNSNNNNTMKGSQPPFWRSSTAPNVTEGSRPNSAGSNFNSDGYSTRGGAHNVSRERGIAFVWVCVCA